MAQRRNNWVVHQTFKGYWWRTVLKQLEIWIVCSIVIFLYSIVCRTPQENYYRTKWNIRLGVLSHMTYPQKFYLEIKWFDGSQRFLRHFFLSNISNITIAFRRLSGGCDSYLLPFNLPHRGLYVQLFVHPQSYEAYHSVLKITVISETFGIRPNSTVTYSVAVSWLHGKGSIF